MCCLVVRDQPRVLSWLSWHPIEQGGQCTHNSSYRPVAVGDNALVASTASSF